MKHIISIGMLCAVFFIPVSHAADYRQEIIDNIVDPCFRIGVRSTPELLEHMTEDEALEASKILASANIEEMINTLSHLVSDLDTLIDRKRVYEMGLGSCVKGMMQGQDKQSNAPAQSEVESATITRLAPAMMDEFRYLVKNSSPYIKEVDIGGMGGPGERERFITLHVSKSVNGKIGKELGTLALDILESNWPDIEPADHEITIIYYRHGGFRSSYDMDIATLLRGKRGKHSNRIVWTY